MRAVKTKEAVNPVLTLIEGENPEYFNNALDTIGEIGGDREAAYLADFLDREDLTVAQRQSLVRVLGKIKATKTYSKLVELARDSDENSFVRMYAAEAIGAMEKSDAVDVLVELYEETDPNLRTYVIKGLSHFFTEEAQKVMIQATRDAYYKVRLEAINAIKEQELQDAVPYLIYRAKNDPERVVKEAVYPVLAFLNKKEGNEYLVSQITDKKVGDTVKSRIAAALLAEDNAGTTEILALAEECLKDDRKKNLRYALGKEFAKYERSEFADICGKYIESKDVSTIGTGLDMYAKGRYASVTPAVQALADKYDPNAKTRNAMAQKACRILGISDEEAGKKVEAAKAEKA
ncbi:MAG: HEAT repeat domain-containing protein, partial [Treponema sp.]|nr:HEAT repeat domain-containing protein [Treponema sp.]